ncbi:MAG TPA: transcription-repair coupling factor, partial [Pirellulales bacterium]|nr:transcription-repair coupling factor [Pirellulales bacterium]
MILSHAETNISGRLLELTGALDDEPGFAEVVASLKAGHGATLGGIWGSSCALAAAALEADAPLALVIVCPRPADVDALAADLALFTATPPEIFPAWETAASENGIDDAIHGDRIRVLKRLAGDAADRPRLVVASIQSLLQPAPSRELLESRTRRLRVGDTVDTEELLRWFAAEGFQNTPAVQLPGEFSRRGGIIDVFAPDWDEPVRIELFGDQIDSIRQFEISSQRSLAPLDSVEITIVKPDAESRDMLTSYLNPRAWFMLVEPDELQEEAKHYLHRVERRQDFHEPAEVLEAIYRFPSVTAAAVAGGSMEATCQLRLESVERFSGDIGKVRSELDSAAARQEVIVVCQTEAEI